jgi:hypothetical protein
MRDEDGYRSWENTSWTTNGDSDIATRTKQRENSASAERMANHNDDPSRGK